MAETVTTVTIYRFQKYDITSDGNVQSRRWGTREAIESIGGEVIEATATQVDASAINPDIPGLTTRKFEPHAQTGFQTRVRV
jgi:hypothetical protein